MLKRHGQVLLLVRKLLFRCAQALCALQLFSATTAFGASGAYSQGDVESMVQQVVAQLEQVGRIPPSGEVQRISVPNTAGIDTAVICQAYITRNELESGLGSLHLPKAALATIETISNVQDGVYLFLLRNGRMVFKDSLGGDVALAERVIGDEVGESLILEVARLDRSWRPIEIRVISSRSRTAKTGDR